MSKEVAAAILTRIYFDKVPGTGGAQLGSHANPISATAAERIGYVYAHFLGKLANYEGWAGKK